MVDSSLSHFLIKHAEELSIMINWLVVLTILKHMSSSNSQWEGLFHPIHEMENKVHVPNHQSVNPYLTTINIY